MVDKKIENKVEKNNNSEVSTKPEDKKETSKKEIVKPITKKVEKQIPENKNDTKTANKKVETKTVKTTTKKEVKKETSKKEIVKPALERVYTINLRKAFDKPRKKRSKRAVTLVREFIQKHMKSIDVKISNTLNNYIWKTSKPPRKVKVKAIKDKNGETQVIKA